MTITLQLWHLVPVLLAAFVALMTRLHKEPVGLFPVAMLLSITVGASIAAGLLAQFAGRCP